MKSTKLEPPKFATTLTENPIQEVYRIICEQANYNAQLIQIFEEAKGYDLAECLVLFMYPDLDVNLINTDIMGNNRILDQLRANIITLLQYDRNDYKKIQDLMEQHDQSLTDAEIDIECLYTHLFCLLKRVQEGIDNTTIETTESVLGSMTQLSKEEIKLQAKKMQSADSAMNSDIKPLYDCIDLLQQHINPEYLDTISRFDSVEDIILQLNRGINRLRPLTSQFVQHSNSIMDADQDKLAAFTRMQLVQQADKLLSAKPIAEIFVQPNNSSNPMQQLLDGLEGKLTNKEKMQYKKIDNKNYIHIHQLIVEMIIPTQNIIKKLSSEDDALKARIRAINASTFLPPGLTDQKKKKPKKPKKKKKHQPKTTKKLEPKAIETIEPIEKQTSELVGTVKSQPVEKPEELNLTPPKITPSEKTEHFLRIKKIQPQSEVPEKVIHALSKHRDDFELMFSKPTPHLQMTFKDLTRLVKHAGGQVIANGGSRYRIVLFGTYTKVLATNPFIAAKQKFKQVLSKTDTKEASSLGKTSLVVHAPHGGQRNNGAVKSYVVNQFKEAFIRVGLEPKKLWPEIEQKITLRK